MRGMSSAQSMLVDLSCNSIEPHSLTSSIVEAASVSVPSLILLWIRRALMAYIDDFLLQKTSVISLCTTVMLAFFAAFGVPISWKKLQLGYNELSGAF